MIKPKIFIGSSVEGLKIAYAIQENLDFVATITIWDQGIFELTSSALDDLITILEKTDIGIFVFSPDDITKISNISFKTTRDNVIFELGLFIGYLGKKRVSFLTPRNTTDFHLPSDLIGVTSGNFDSEREDGNIRAALSPYCNQIKKLIEETCIINLTNFKNDKKLIQKLILEKPDYWEFLLSKEILKDETVKLRKEISLIEQELYLNNSKILNIFEFIKLIQERVENFLQLLQSFKNNYYLIQKAWGKPGVAGDENLIKETMSRMVYYGFEALELEKANKGLIIPNSISDLKEYLKDWSKLITNFIFSFQERLEFYFENSTIPEGTLDFSLTMEWPENLNKFTERLNYYTSNIHLLIDDI